ncbi:SDR family NAD(P)-dependent oxidoreductase [Epibacterium ulvae]|uniref:SDR family NAD(P)-dependent oxidoreductase n=1 Tax=Epibacterium ulvae TaxID=1156985 RepID=UPI002491C411|nr:SDR family oxidoreductase [Epibacterium ulvae]
MTPTALITGASSGIGAEFARYHASKGGNLILVARREPPMQELKAELEKAHGVAVTVIAMDVGTSEQAKLLFETVKTKGLDVGILINNAGFGGHGPFLNADLEKTLAMIDLNVSALVALSYLFGNEMKTRGGGKMLQVSSTASFMPGPNQAVYFATKAFVTSFSQSIDQEMRKEGITSTALCPGLVHTEFVAAAGLESTGLAAQKGATPASVAKCGYDAMQKGKLIAINEGRLAFLLNWITPLLPRRQVLNMIESMQTKTGS